MPMTITEKILARHADWERVAPGGPHRGQGRSCLRPRLHGPHRHPGVQADRRPEGFRPRVVLVADHFVPNKDVLGRAGKVHARVAGSSSEYYYEVGEAGIGHVPYPSRGSPSPARSSSRTAPRLRLRGLGAFSPAWEYRHGRRDGHRARSRSRSADDPGRLCAEALRPYVAEKTLILRLIGEIDVGGIAQRPRGPQRHPPRAFHAAPVRDGEHGRRGGGERRDHRPR